MIFRSKEVLVIDNVADGTHSYSWIFDTVSMFKSHVQNVNYPARNEINDVHFQMYDKDITIMKRVALMFVDVGAVIDNYPETLLQLPGISDVSV